MTPLTPMTPPTPDQVANYTACIDACIVFTRLRDQFEPGSKAWEEMEAAAKAARAAAFSIFR